MKTKYLNVSDVPLAIMDELDAAADDACLSRKAAFLAVLRRTPFADALRGVRQSDLGEEGSSFASFGVHLPTADHRRVKSASARSGVRLDWIGRYILVFRRGQIRKLLP